MAKGFKKGAGGSNPLNFKVVGGTTRPSGASENTIWVNTDTDITSWVFSATEPAVPTEGMVWFLVGASSPVEFNVLKKNCLQVYPLSAKQYISGAFVGKEFEAYQNGGWVSGATLLYNYDSLGYTWATKGIKVTDSGGAYAVAPVVTIDANGIMNIRQNTEYGAGIAYILGKFDLTNFDTLEFNGVLNSAHVSSGYATSLCIWSDFGSYTFDNVVARLSSLTDGVGTLDISALSGSYYIGFGMHHSGSYCDVSYIGLT